ncbi:uncharacterized protein K441DRAFT_532828, partial [Cenococcum geophilum 1.58]|uniref:uncharacterized protein n=1 Tax=Cenococcum geophilum 1.58 TaxID=794803 RepID=UPI00358FD90C
ILQLIDVLKYVYSRGVIYSNISYYNILLDKYLNAKLINFASLLINRSPLLALYLKDEIFAFGSAYYYILMRYIAFYKLSNDDIEDRYK